MGIKEQAKALAALFPGLEHAYGNYILTSEKLVNENYAGSGEKIKGKAYTRKGKWGVQNWIDHIEGKTGLGVIPINSENKVKWGAIDYDRYDVDLIKLCIKFENLPFIPVRTKSGGIHIYVFFTNFISASAVRKKLVELATAMGFGGCEIFPKQIKLEKTQSHLANWLNMPYFRGKKTDRFAIVNGKAISLDEFIKTANLSKVTLREFNELTYSRPEKDDLALPDGPPCLNHLIELGFPSGTRNNGLFNLAIYYKRATGDDWEKNVEEANKKYMKPPLDKNEVQQVIKSVGKKENYVYKCSDQPICTHCDKGVCVTRKYGMSGLLGATFPKLSGLIKLNTTPPQYFLSINDTEIGPVQTDDLILQVRFQKMCFERLSLVTPKLKDFDWRNILQSLVEEEKIVEVPKEASAEGRLLEYLEDFCTGRQMTTDVELMHKGRVFFDEESNCYYFKMPAFIEYLQKKKFNEFRSHEISGVFHKYGIKNIVKKFTERPERYWCYNIVAYKESIKAINYEGVPY